jgi:hypothetical protein
MFKKRNLKIATTNINTIFQMSQLIVHLLRVVTNQKTTNNCAVRTCAEGACASVADYRLLKAKRRIEMRLITIVLLSINIALAQGTNQVYEIPFPAGSGTSNDNTIELLIANTSSRSTDKVKVDVTTIPEGIKFNKKTVTLDTLKAKEGQTASFTFSVDKTAKVNKELTISFTITDKNAQKWMKEISIKIAPPNNYELFQNYPNPFNPTTKIEYQLPASCKVNLIVYDILGREAANLVNEQQEAGYHQMTFDAHRLASGTYIYRIIALDEQNNRHIFQKKMLVLK